MEQNYEQQGDVLLFKVESLPEKCTLVEKGNVTIEQGTANGNKHVVTNAEMYKDEQLNDTYIVCKDSLIVHEEHNNFKLVDGIYRKGIVQEYDHFEEESRNVED